jgi:predicted GTPase
MHTSHSQSDRLQETKRQAARRRWQLWVLAACVGLPLSVFGVTGALWLYERHWLRWVGLALVCGEALLLWLVRRWSRQDEALLPQPSAVLPATFAPRDEAAWALVQAYLERVEHGEITLESPEQCLALGREILERIATHYHPSVPEPLLAIPVPLLFRAIEETARDLAQVTGTLPLSHRLTIGHALRGYRLHQKILPAYNVYRLLYPLFNWQNAIVQYLVTDRLFDLTKHTLTQWLLKWYVDRVGYHAIELYSGQLLLTRQVALPESAPQRHEARQHAAPSQTVPTTPLRILVLGQVKAGKSSLVNALFGTLQAATDVLPTTARLTSYVLDRADLGGTIIVSDMGGYEEPNVPRVRLEEACAEAQRADLLLLVLSAINAAREPDRRLLSQLRDHFVLQPALRPPPVVVLLTHIDLLRPRREWTPPYNIVSPHTAKAHAILGAVQAVATELQLPEELIVPVCLLPTRLYNVEEALVPLLSQVLPDAKRVLLLRSLKTLRQQEEWELLGRQARATGQFLLQLGGALVKKSLEHVWAQGRR